MSAPTGNGNPNIPPQNPGRNDRQAQNPQDFAQPGLHQSFQNPNPNASNASAYGHPGSYGGQAGGHLNAGQGYPPSNTNVAPGNGSRYDQFGAYGGDVGPANDPGQGQQDPGRLEYHQLLRQQQQEQQDFPQQRQPDNAADHLRSMRGRQGGPFVLQNTYGNPGPLPIANSYVPFQQNFQPPLPGQYQQTNANYLPAQHQVAPGQVQQAAAGLSTTGQQINPPQAQHTGLQGAMAPNSAAQQIPSVPQRSADQSRYLLRTTDRADWEQQVRRNDSDLNGAIRTSNQDYQRRVEEQKKRDG